MTAREPGRIISRRTGLRRDVDALRVLGLHARPALAQARDLGELAPDLDDHLLGGAADRLHRQRREGEGQHPADEQPDDDLDVGQVDHVDADRCRVGAEQRERGQRCRADREALATAAVVLPSESRESVISRTSGGMCAISAMPPALSEIGPVRVDGDDRAGGGEHADRGERGGVEPTEGGELGPGEGQGAEPVRPPDRAR
jgi:hypothetical protein